MKTGTRINNRHGRRKSEIWNDLGKRIYDIKKYDPELSFAIIAVRLGYSAPRIGQAYKEYCAAQAAQMKEKAAA